MDFLIREIRGGSSERASNVNPSNPIMVGLALCAGNDSTPMIRMEEKGREHATIASPKSKSNVLAPSVSWLLIRLMCAKGQKLQELCGKTMASSIMSGEY